MRQRLINLEALPHKVGWYKHRERCGVDFCQNSLYNFASCFDNQTKGGNNEICDTENNLKENRRGRGWINAILKEFWKNSEL